MVSHDWDGVLGNLPAPKVPGFLDCGAGTGVAPEDVSKSTRCAYRAICASNAAIATALDAAISESC